MFGEFKISCEGNETRTRKPRNKSLTIPLATQTTGRPSLEKLFSGQSRVKASRDRLIVKAVTRYGYSQMDVANFLALHYSTVSRIVASADQEQSQKT